MFNCTQFIKMYADAPASLMCQPHQNHVPHASNTSIQTYLLQFTRCSNSHGHRSQMNASRLSHTVRTRGWLLYHHQSICINSPQALSAASCRLLMQDYACAAIAHALCHKHTHTRRIHVKWCNLLCCQQYCRM